MAKMIRELTFQPKYGWDDEEDIFSRYFAYGIDSFSGLCAIGRPSTHASA